MWDVLNRYQLHTWLAPVTHTTLPTKALRLCLPRNSSDRSASAVAKVYKAISPDVLMTATVLSATDTQPILLQDSRTEFGWLVVSERNGT